MISYKSDRAALSPTDPDTGDAKKVVAVRARNGSAIAAISTVSLLDDLMTMMRSNMSDDGEYSTEQIDNQYKLTTTAIRLVELELKIRKELRRGAEAHKADDE